MHCDFQFIYLLFTEKKIKKSKNIGISLLSIRKQKVNKIMHYEFRFIHPFFAGKKVKKSKNINI